MMTKATGWKKALLVHGTPLPPGTFIFGKVFVISFLYATLHVPEFTQLGKRCGVLVGWRRKSIQYAFAVNYTSRIRLLLLLNGFFWTAVYPSSLAPAAREPRLAGLAGGHA